MLLEKDYMEDIMDLGPGRKLQAVSNIAYALKHQVWPVVFRGQLARRLVGDAGCRTVMKTQPGPITNLHGNVTMPFIIVLLHGDLGGEETIPDLLQKHVPLLELLVQGSDAGHSWLIRGHGRRGATIDDLKRCRPQRCLVRRVVAEFRPGKPAKPRTRPIARQTAKVHAQDAVGHLGLPIGLRVKCRAEAKLDAREVEQLRPECAGEDGVPIADDGTWNAVEAHNLVEEGTRHRGRRVGVAEGDEVRIFGEPVDDGEDDRLAADARESFHEVECDILPYRCGHRKRLEETGGM